MRRLLIFLFLMMIICVGCQWRLRPSQMFSGNEQEPLRLIDRYDLLEHQFLSTGDFSAFQLLTTSRDTMTHILLEDVLHIGKSGSPGIMHTLLTYFQDSTLEVLLGDVEREYATMQDVDGDLYEAFQRLQTMLPGTELPHVYTQIGSFEQSITVEDGYLGISLDKYLGSDYPAYEHLGYTERQRRTMTRSYIVPDCVGFFLISLYPLDEERDSRAWHIARIHSVVNRAVGRSLFTDSLVTVAGTILDSTPGISVDDFLAGRIK